MSMFDKPGSLEAATAWNGARAAYVAANEAYKAARQRNWEALAEMARAHKHCVESVGLEHAEMFAWCDALYGDRDQILHGASLARIRSAS